LRGVAPESGPTEPVASFNPLAEEEVEEEEEEEEEEDACGHGASMALEELTEARDEGEMLQEDFDVLAAGLDSELCALPLLEEASLPLEEQAMTLEELLEARDAGELAQEDFELLAASVSVGQLRAARRAGKLRPGEFEVRSNERH
jgi:hypothetical protein